MKIRPLLYFAIFLFISCRYDNKLNGSSKIIKNDSLNKIINSSADSSSFKRTKEVFGFHPYWLENSFENYDYKLLSSISYFDYDLNPHTGNYRTIRDWKTTKLIDSAKANNTKVYLTVTNFSKSNNLAFLNNEKAQETSISTIIQLLNDREAYGVTIDFEDVPCEMRNKYSKYISKLSMRLKKSNKKVVITLPALDNRNCFDVKYLEKYVEFFIIMAKNYYGRDSHVAGPVAPLYGKKLWTPNSIAQTVKSYLNKGIPTEKFILSLPYYGNKWETKDDKVPSVTKKFLGTLSYKTIKNNYPQPVYYEPESQTNYLNYKKDKKFIQVWFDNAKSLGKKYDYINSEDLAGVGIWALGYDDGYPELWEILRTKFGKIDTVFVLKN